MNNNNFQIKQDSTETTKTKAIIKNIGCNKYCVPETAYILEMYLYNIENTVDNYHKVDSA